MAAPPSLCLAGYLTVFSNPSENYSVHTFTTGYIYDTSCVCIFFRILRISFNPSYASFTFPLAIGATAVLKYSNYLYTLNSRHYILWHNIGLFYL